MQFAYPDYYPQFRCIAGDCRHSCCIGWEIDIDDASLARWQALPGEMGARLRGCISSEGTPHFVLTEGERCPLLNSDGLCDLILAHGQDALCQICADHPRFRSFFPGRTETGLGLCCEAAAQLILSQPDGMRLTVSGAAEPNDERDAFLALRDALFDIAQDRSRSVAAREEALLRRVGAHLPDYSARQLTEYFLALERMDEAWTARLRALRDTPATDASAFSALMRGRETEYENLLVYFLFRHLSAAAEDGDAAGKVAFAVLSVRLLRALGAAEFSRSGAFSFSDQAELARQYSAEVEYSQENLDTLFDDLADGCFLL